MKGGSIAHMLAYLLPNLAARGSIPSTPVIFSEEKVVVVDEVNHQCCFVKSGQ